MGGTSASSEETFDASVLITITGAIDGPPDQLEVTGVEVIDGPGSVDMARSRSTTATTTMTTNSCVSNSGRKAATPGKLLQARDKQGKWGHD